MVWYVLKLELAKEFDSAIYTAATVRSTFTKLKIKCGAVKTAQAKTK